VNKLLKMDRRTVQNKFVKLVHLFGSVTKKFVTMHGHMNVKMPQHSLLKPQITQHVWKNGNPQTKSKYNRIVQRFLSMCRREMCNNLLMNTNHVVTQNWEHQLHTLLFDYQKHFILVKYILCM